MPELWSEILRARVPFYGELAEDLRPRFHEYLKIFVWEKHWLPAGGMTITDEVRVTIAAAAVRLILHLPLSIYDRLTEIVVYPGHYKHPDRDHVVFGEAHDWGTVVLSWDAVQHGLDNPHDGQDTTTHEFAHVLDRDSGAFNGAPELRSREHYRAWAGVLGHHFRALREGQREQRKVLDDYGALNEAEFFAVATESFFEKSRMMQEHTPDLYRELARFYGFDPAGEGKE